LSRSDEGYIDAVSVAAVWMGPWLSTSDPATDLVNTTREAIARSLSDEFRTAVRIHAGDQYIPCRWSKTKVEDGALSVSISWTHAAHSPGPGQLSKTRSAVSIIVIATQKCMKMFPPCFCPYTVNAVDPRFALSGGSLVWRKMEAQDAQSHVVVNSPQPQLQGGIIV
jgi:hypothetical protein